MPRLHNILTYSTLAVLTVLLCWPQKNLRAQLCGGGLGDAAFNESFDQNGSLSQSVTSYKAAFGCPAPGEYVLTNFIYGCGEKTWFVTAGDHTRSISHNTNSNVMLVNAGGVPGTVYTNTVDGLCGNITYEFSAFVTNMMNTYTCGGSPKMANLTFSVSDAAGTLSASYSTGDIIIETGINWRHFGLSFTTPATPSPVTIKITSNSPLGCGSAFAIDDITIRPCGTQVNVTVNGGSAAPIDICEGYTDNYVLKADYFGFTKPKTIWQQSADTGYTWTDIPGAVTTTYTVPHKNASITMYRIIVAEDVNFNSPKCRLASNPVYIGIHTSPKPQPPIQVAACLDKDLKMPFIPGGANYKWSGPHGYQSLSVQAVVPAMQYIDTGLYTVLVINDFGCTALDSAYVSVFPSVTLSVTKNYAVCEGALLQFDASGGGTYTWTPATGLNDYTIPNPVHKVTDSVKYQVLIANQYGCKDSATVEVDVYRKINLTAGPDKYITEGDTVSLTPTITGTSVNYTWYPNTFINSTTALNPKVNPPLGEYTYTLRAQSGAGCGNGIDDVVVHVYKEMYIPNAFTPNNDGYNDVFRIIPFNNFTLNRLTIYNRWGMAVYNSSNASAGWDGRYHQQPQPTGSYIYYLDMTTKDGKKLIRKGSILLIR